MGSLSGAQGYNYHLIKDSIGYCHTSPMGLPLIFFDVHINHPNNPTKEEKRCQVRWEYNHFLTYPTELKKGVNEFCDRQDLISSEPGGVH